MMATYVSTRRGDRASLDEALFLGLARDGGLYVPRSLGRLPSVPPNVDRLIDTALWAVPSLFEEVDPGELRAVTSEALSFPAPLVEVEPGVFVLELFHGPTHAFKDVGARFFARLASRRDRGTRTRTVLVATSGDTGGAVADAFHAVPGFRVVVLFPIDGVSERQRRQMTTLGGNVVAVAVRGSFDDCQRMVKEAFADGGLREEHLLTSANSINVGRLLPQALYYVHAAASVGWDRTPPRFVVPSGNLGNLCAGLFAHRMGMPADGFVAASNANRGFVDYLDGRPFEPRSTIATASSAMDVGAPSNIERIRWLHDDDDEAVRRALTGVAVDDAEAAACMEDVLDRHGYLLDPHGAVAYAAHRRTPNAGDGPTVVLATAHPAKFPDVTERALGRQIALPAGLARTAELAEDMIEIPSSLGALARVLADQVPG